MKCLNKWIHLVKLLSLQIKEPFLFFLGFFMAEPPPLQKNSSCSSTRSIFITQEKLYCTDFKYSLTLTSSWANYVNALCFYLFTCKTNNHTIYLREFTIRIKRTAPFKVFQTGSGHNYLLDNLPGRFWPLLLEILLSIKWSSLFCL